MMDKTFFSIIVPVYNVEKYIVRCLKSILSQSYSNFELIVVDDESPDNSLSLIKENFEDERIKIIHKKNGGLSDARNYGLAHAKGDYVWFIDSDDYVTNPDALYKIEHTITKFGSSLEIIIFNAEVIYDFMNRENIIIENAVENTEITTGYDYIKTFKTMPYNAWTQCYKRDFLVENSLEFPVGLYFEDIYMNLDVYAKCKKIIGLNEVFYTYFRTENSITSMQSNEKHFISQAKVIQKFNVFLKNQYLPLEYLTQRMQIEFERTKTYYKTSFQNLNKEASATLKNIAVPEIKTELLSQKLEKKIFFYFPIFVLNNKVLFRKLGTLERMILRKK